MQTSTESIKNSREFRLKGPDHHKCEHLSTKQRNATKKVEGFLGFIHIPLSEKKKKKIVQETLIKSSLKNQSLPPLLSGGEKEKSKK